MVGVKEELGRTVTPYTLPPDSPNLRMLMATVNDRQRDAYLEPYVRGETISAIGISEPGAGADPAGMTTRAVQGRRRLGDQRPQDLDQPRRRRRLHHPDGRHRQGQARARRHLGLPGRQGHAGLQRRCAAFR